jgi:putative pyruvate formate lyase activating enzyme
MIAPGPQEKTDAGIRPAVRRAELAAQRLSAARAALSCCNLCNHHCGANRLAGETGLCHAGVEARYFSAQTEVSDESSLGPVFSIALGGCDMRCVFCITSMPSWNAAGGNRFIPENMAKAAVQALGKGARSIMILGGEPTIHIPAVLEFISHLPDGARLIWKTNGHGSELSRKLLDGLFDCWVVDYKFGSEDCTRRLAGTSDYLSAVHENLLWAASRSRLIVRHLLMPGHVDCCWRPVAAWLASHLPEVEVNLRTAFWPIKGNQGPAELRGVVNGVEAKTARLIAREYQLNLIS